MELTTLTIGTHRFLLRVDVDIDAFQAELLATVRDGGGVIEIPTAGTDRVDALVTPGVPLLFEHRHISEDGADSDWNGSTPFVPWDEFDTYLA
ncbi:hypothetical protein [Marisediminicola senii]|uniref:hypothetical protein n=1 Tax=Marisediminicola senii TaxID=2711233 RepID=UPI0013EDE7ED|nr:hypothetical protein [Marisediminicola senii]